MRAQAPVDPGVLHELTPRQPLDVAVLEEIQQRVLWLATRMIDVANRRDADDIKVGGHQASSASMVSIMTAMWFGCLKRDDKVAVKPHASPVYHAIKYLTGELDRSYLTTLRAKGGLQAYPSRTKDPDVADFSTGSVGLGAVAPLFASVVHRYLASRVDHGTTPRFVALVGDAELDEGNVWEAVLEPMAAELGNFTLVVDVNRQSLDRIIPDIQVKRLAGFFRGAGWHVTEAKYGSKLRSVFERDGGTALRVHLDAMTNEAYQSLFGLHGDQLRSRLLHGADPDVVCVVDKLDDDELLEAVTDLGGHDLELLIETFRSCDEEPNRPSVVFAYTIKGWRLPIAGHPLNHAALLSADEIDALRAASGLDPDAEWDRFDPDSAAGQLCELVGQRLNNVPPPPRPSLPIPAAASRVVRSGKVSTQDAFGRSLGRLADVPGVGDRIVTAAPDVSISTNLGGWINKAGVYSHRPREDYGGKDRLLKWVPSPSGQHIELGISEMNLFLLLGQFGLSHEHHGHLLLPIGTVYDPFVLRGLDALVYSLYNAARFVIAGTPSGVSLAPEGGAHQSTITPSVGLELPGLTYVEPAFATEVDWLLCDALTRLSAPQGDSTYLRLSTRPLEQQPFASALDQYGEDRLRQLVLAGGYRLATLGEARWPHVTLVTTGVTVSEALAASAELHSEGVSSTVVHLTSPDRVYRMSQGQHRQAASTATVIRTPSLLHRLVPPQERSFPIVSVHDGASHSLAWLGSALGTHQIALGVDQFGESGTIQDLYGTTGISAGHIVNAALLAIHESTP